jgi:DNA-directed RNA polymerase specialized sigma24 family protein
MDSIELVELLKSNKEKGLSCLYDKYAPILNGMVIRIVASEEQAEEVLQQIFLKIAYSIDSYDKDSLSLFTWMSRIARQEALKACDPQASRNVSDPMQNNYSPLVSNITPEYKEVLDRMYILGYTPSETALHLHLPEATVKSRLHLAINQMRQVIQSDPGYLLNKTLFITLSLAAVS